MDGLIGHVKKAKPGKVEEDLPVDRLNSFYTALLFVICSIVIGTIQIFGDPLRCWTGKEFNKAWNEFAKTYCWIQNTYYVPVNASLPESEQARRELEIGYYQWVPIVLALLALLFYLPRFLWRSFNYKTGINFHYLVKTANDDEFKNMLAKIERKLKKKDKLKRTKPWTLKKLKEENKNLFENLKLQLEIKIKRSNKQTELLNIIKELLEPHVMLSLQDQIKSLETMKKLFEDVEVKISQHFNNHFNVAKHLLDVLKERRTKSVTIFSELKHSLFCVCGGTRPTNYLILLYMFIMLLYIVNAVSQFYLLNLFLKPKYKLFGFEILRDLAMGLQWTESEHFPRVTVCDFSVRSMSGTVNYSIQCVLQSNMFNEKIFIFLWFWILMVASVTIVKFLHWCIMFILPRSEANFIKGFYTCDTEDLNDFHIFIKKNIGHDGMLTLYILSQNKNVFLPDIIERMWDLYLKNETIQHSQEPV